MDIPAPVSRPTAEQKHTFQFKGDASEYFKIWIVNIFITVITLGIYAAWAKVRNRQYFYRNTFLAGQPFDYLANPIAILKGNLIITLAVLIYFASGYLSPLLTLFFFCLYALLVPLAITKALRFRAYNTGYRNLRFHFRGKPKESYTAYLLLPLLTLFTLGLSVPYMAFCMKKYLYSHIAFGRTQTNFSGQPGNFYRIYLTIFVFFLPLVAILFMTDLLEIFSGPTSTSVIPQLSALLSIVVGVLFVFFAPAYLYVHTTNYSLNQTILGNCRLQSTLRLRDILWINFTNVLGVMATFGLLIPWAKVRSARYKLEHLTVHLQGDFDQFIADEEVSASALGEAAVDFFDIDIGG